MKHEWRKHEKNLYLPTEKPNILEIPPMKYLTISGTGDPNQEDFSERTGVLYSLAYGVRMSPRKNIHIPNYKEYTVYPLEGDWTFVDDWDDTMGMDKNKLSYNVMIRQPDFLTDESFQIIFKNVMENKPNDLLNEVKFVTLPLEKAVQILHIGSYDDEAATFEIMNKFLEENNLKRKSYEHREIYLSDPRKTKAEKMKTVLRYNLKNN